MSPEHHSFPPSRFLQMLITQTRQDLTPRMCRTQPIVLPETHLLQSIILTPSLGPTREVSDHFPFRYTRISTHQHGSLITHRTLPNDVDVPSKCQFHGFSHTLIAKAAN
ncbi:hypothetical protein CDAR_74841 [Caerostris darwini]|uniref:Uncharacterized protein n=1 Tax=Caerostris darwini TaxID=1538125 RepID=A0AAV4P1K4_9ARAC|nr:hypothetical protein CDAR_74841 [Caerostris darwini]